MWRQSHGMEPCIDLFSGQSYVRNVWDAGADAGATRYLFRHNGAWRISGALDPVVKIDDKTAEPYAVVNGYPAYRCGREGGGKTLFRSTSYGWVVATELEEPLEYDYTVRDFVNDEMTTVMVRAGTAFWSGTLPSVGNVETFVPRGVASGNVSVGIEWTCWVFELGQNGYGTEGTDRIPAMGVYRCTGKSPITVGFPCWGPIDNTDDWIFTLRAGTLLRTDGDDTPLHPDGASSGAWLLRSDADGAWLASTAPVPEQAWVFTYAYAEGHSGPEKATISLAPGRRILPGAGCEYVYPTARIP